MKSCIAILVFLTACNSPDSSEQKKSEGLTSENQPSSENQPVPAADKPAPDKPAPDKPAPDKPAPDKPAPDKPAPELAPTTRVPNTLRLVVVDPNPPIVRKRKKRKDSKGDFKSRERNLRKQQERIEKLAAALGTQATVEKVNANEAEREFATALSMGVENKATLPLAWDKSERVLVLELAPATDLTKRSGGFVSTGTSKVALFVAPNPVPVYQELASEGMEVDTAELAQIVAESRP